MLCLQRLLQQSGTFSFLLLSWVKASQIFCCLLHFNMSLIHLVLYSPLFIYLFRWIVLHSPLGYVLPLVAVAHEFLHESKKEREGGKKEKRKCKKRIQKATREWKEAVQCSLVVWCWVLYIVLPGPCPCQDLKLYPVRKKVGSVLWVKRVSRNRKRR